MNNLEKLIQENANRTHYMSIFASFEELATHRAGYVSGFRDGFMAAVGKSQESEMSRPGARVRLNNSRWVLEWANQEVKDE